MAKLTVAKKAVKKRAPGGGRKKKLTPCPYCRKKFGVADLRAHLTGCRFIKAGF